MLHTLLNTVICQTFLKECGKWQSKKETPKAFFFEFSTSVDHKIEEGYRHIEVLLYASMNYVQVWTRRTYTVIPLADLEEGADGESRVKKGKDYNEGATPWEKVCDHDSCWRDGVSKIIWDNRNDLSTFSGSIGEWYKLVDPEKTIPGITG
jgi:hypothetical protein